MEHEGIFALAFQCIDDLCVAGRTQRYGTDCLCFTACKQG